MSILLPVCPGSIFAALSLHQLAANAAGNPFPFRLYRYSRDNSEDFPLFHRIIQNFSLLDLHFGLDY